MEEESPDPVDRLGRPGAIQVAVAIVAAVITFVVVQQVLGRAYYGVYIELVYDPRPDDWEIHLYGNEATQWVGAALAAAFVGWATWRMQGGEPWLHR